MLQNNFKTVLKDWLSEDCVDEWYFESFKQRIVQELNSQQAFSLIDDAIDVLIDQKDESDLIDVLEVVLVLSNLSDTTELPKTLLENKRKIKMLFSNKGDYVRLRLNELFKLYRLA